MLEADAESERREIVERYEVLVGTDNPGQVVNQFISDYTFYRDLSLRGSTRFIVPGIEFNDRGGTIRRDDLQIQLTPKERNLFRFFLANLGIILQRSVITNITHIRSGRSVDTHLCRLREKIDELGDPPFFLIRTVRGIGYKAHLLEQVTQGNFNFGPEGVSSTE